MIKRVLSGITAILTTTLFSLSVQRHLMRHFIIVVSLLNRHKNSNKDCNHRRTKIFKTILLWKKFKKLSLLAYQECTVRTIIVANLWSSSFSVLRLQDRRKSIAIHFILIELIELEVRRIIRERELRVVILILEYLGRLWWMQKVGIRMEMKTWRNRKIREVIISKINGGKRLW